MWLVDPKLMCRQHLLGEHLEIHMLTGTLNKGMSIDGYITGGLVDVLYIERRHSELVEEMLVRGYNHRTPLILSEKVKEVLVKLFVVFGTNTVDPDENLRELARRCPECREIQNRLTNRVTTV